MDRISILCTYLDKCKSFADVACDHAYCAEYMLNGGLCESAVVSDISAKSLAKAQSLLDGYIKEGKCRAICCDGLEEIDPDTEQILIAGIGGEEIVRIMKNSYIPKNFVFQPMKNADFLRAYLLDKGCELTCDDIFTDGKNYYFIIKGKLNGKGGGGYNKARLEFGRDSLSNPVLRGYLESELEKKKGYLLNDMNEKSRAEITDAIAFIEGVLNGEID